VRRAGSERYSERLHSLERRSVVSSMSGWAADFGCGVDYNYAVFLSGSPSRWGHFRLLQGQLEREARAYFLCNDRVINERRCVPHTNKCK